MMVQTSDQAVAWNQGHTAVQSFVQVVMQSQGAAAHNYVHVQATGHSWLKLHAAA